MDSFELYMIDLMKDYADRFRGDNQDDIKWMHKCVLDELAGIFSKYEVDVKGNCDL